MNEGPLSRSYYQRFDTRKDTAMEAEPIQGEKLEAEPMQVTNEHRGGVTIEWPGGKIEPEWCDAKMRAVALELAVKTAEAWSSSPRSEVELHQVGEEIVTLAGEFFLFVCGEGRDKPWDRAMPEDSNPLETAMDPQGRTESGL